MNSLLLVLTIFSLGEALFETWKPESYRYCEHLTSTNTSAPNLGGVSCGYSSYFYMNYEYALTIDSTSTLGLINVGWLSANILGTENKFWKTCKSYMITIFDSLFSDEGKSCIYAFNHGFSGLPTCTKNDSNLLLRVGSGYCMKQKVCGADQKIDFLVSSDKKSSQISWEDSRTATLKSNGYTVVGSCYAYEKLSNPTKSNASIANTTSFY
ncbi:unnamed protein product [Caenorhabditis angaria]|uniref:DUF281 domain-containing protein n=1 Tax=Caenorhabditis angaria TaxID=860376 RepID=A0A9P1ICF8_9PELO|nr:unnamed protein product [Caenorhabditis angaria]